MKFTTAVLLTLGVATVVESACDSLCADIIAPVCGADNKWRLCMLELVLKMMSLC
jgi:hypothetical protein